MSEFSEQAAVYAKHRPRYPDALFDHVASLVDRRDLAWDCGTGNGQAATLLAERFARVIATDVSGPQIENAVAHPRVTYRVAPAEDAGVASGSCDLVTVAQALHWFDLDRFYPEVRRVLRPGGVVMASVYQHTDGNPEVDEILRRYYYEVVGAHWAPQVVWADGHYAQLPFPFEAMAAPQGLFASATWGFPQMLGYLDSWSATRAFMRAKQRNPVDAIRSELEAVWGARGRERTIRWPLTVRIGRVERK